MLANFGVVKDQLAKLAVNEFVQFFGILLIYLTTVSKQELVTEPRKVYWHDNARCLHELRVARSFIRWLFLLLLHTLIIAVVIAFR